MLALRLLSISIGLSLQISSPPILLSPGGQDAPEKPESLPGRETLAGDIESFLKAVDAVAVVEKTHEELGVRVTLIPDAGSYEALLRLREALAAGLEPRAALEKLREEEKELRKLDGRAGARIDFFHPGEPSDDPGERKHVHLFPGKLSRAIRLSSGNRDLNWKRWREPVGLEFRKVRIARHYTVRNRVRVPFVSELEPKGVRAVFAGSRATVWALVPPAVVDAEKSKGAPLALRIPHHEQYHGFYDGRHILDLNDSGHTFETDGSFEARGLPALAFPPLPVSLRDFLERLRAEG